MSEGAASLRLIAALLLVNRNGVAGESSPCDWVSFNRCSATLTCDTVAINRSSAAFNHAAGILTCRSRQLTLRSKLTAALLPLTISKHITASATLTRVADVFLLHFLKIKKNSISLHRNLEQYVSFLLQTVIRESGANPEQYQLL